MPAGQPFTQLCQTLARPKYFGRVDLHLHTTCSDGTYTPGQVVDLAQRSGLSAIAITDHDTIAGIAPASQAAGNTLEVITGVEITAEFRGKELHLLGYLFDSQNIALNKALEHLQNARVDRFREMVARLRHLGVSITETEVARLQTGSSLGRRHLAEILVENRQAGSVREAFQRWLGDNGRATVPKARLPVADAIRLVRDAGGVASWAHPLYDCTKESLRDLKNLGLNAVEVEYPTIRPSRGKELAHWACELGLAITGGSDCHGPGPRQVGAASITYDELERLRKLSNIPDPRDTKTRRNPEDSVEIAEKQAQSS